MGKSGNPARAAKEAEQKEIQHDVAQAVAQGQWIIVRPFPHTEVRIKSTEVQEAKMVVESMQPMDDDMTAQGLDGWVHTLMMYMMLSEDPKIRQEITRALNMLNNHWKEQLDMEKQLKR